MGLRQGGAGGEDALEPEGAASASQGWWASCTRATSLAGCLKLSLYPAFPRPGFLCCEVKAAVVLPLGALCRVSHINKGSCLLSSYCARLRPEHFLLSCLNNPVLTAAPGEGEQAGTQSTQGCANVALTAGDVPGAHAPRRSRVVSGSAQGVCVASSWNPSVGARVPGTALAGKGCCLFGGRRDRHG